MRWGWLWLIALFALGCGASTPEPKRAAADEDDVSSVEPRRASGLDWARVPVGDVFVAFGETASLGWIDLRVRGVKPCGKGVIGVEVELKNRGEAKIDPYSLRPKLFDRKGREIPPSYGGRDCKSHHGDIAVGASASGWLVFDGTRPSADLLEMAFKEPRGMGSYRVMLALRGDTPRPELNERVAPSFGEIGKALAGPVETRFYRVALMNVRACRAPSSTSDPIEVGLELLIENRSNVALALDHRPLLRDNKGYSYERTIQFSFGRDKDQCGESLPSQVSPGDRVRGWVKAFEVPPGARDLVLHYELVGDHYEGVVIKMATGKLPKVKVVPPPPPPPPPVAPPVPDPSPANWEKPRVLKAAVDGVTLTVTDVRPCLPSLRDGFVHVGVEVLIENRASVPITLPWEARLQDAKSYRYKMTSRFHDTQACLPLVDTTLPLEPGEKIRGWLNHFPVPVSARDMLLRYQFTLEKKQDPKRWQPLEPSNIVVPVGHLK